MAFSKGWPSEDLWAHSAALGGALAVSRVHSCEGCCRGMGLSLQEKQARWHMPDRICVDAKGIPQVLPLRSPAHLGFWDYLHWS